MDINKLNEICAKIAERAREKNPMDLEAIIKMYEEESKKIDIKVMISQLF